MPMREPRPHRRGERFTARPEVGLFAVDWFAPAKVAATLSTSACKTKNCATTEVTKPAEGGCAIGAVSKTRSACPAIGLDGRLVIATVSAPAARAARSSRTVSSVLPLSEIAIATASRDAGAMTSSATLLSR